MSKQIKPTDSELEILNILWAKGPSTVREIHEVLEQNKEAGYTTSLKLLQIMHEKGHLGRQKSGKLHLYKAIVSQENTQQQMIDRMIETVFSGSAAGLVMSALGTRKSSKGEIKAIREYLDQLEKGDK